MSIACGPLGTCPAPLIVENQALAGVNTGRHQLLAVNEFSSSPNVNLHGLAIPEGCINLIVSA